MIYLNLGFLYYLYIYIQFGASPEFYSTIFIWWLLNNCTKILSSLISSFAVMCISFSKPFTLVLFIPFLVFEACVHYFLSNFHFSLDDSPWTTEKCFLFHFLFVFLFSPPLLSPVSNCFRGWSNINLKTCNIINCPNKNLITHFVWYLVLLSYRVFEWTQLTWWIIWSLTINSRYKVTNKCINQYSVIKI